MMMIKSNPSFAGIRFLLWVTSSPTYATSSKKGTQMFWHMILMLRTGGKPQISISYGNLHRPKAKRKKEKMFLCTMHRLTHLRAPTPQHAAGLWSRGDEPDRSDQSTEITVIPEVRRRAPGHSEFTQPTQAPNKSGQEWQTFGPKKLRFHLKNDTLNFNIYLTWRLKRRSEFGNRHTTDRSVYSDNLRWRDSSACVNTEEAFVCF